MTFRQHGRWLSKREYTINNNGLFIINKSLFGSSEEYYNFRQIGKSLLEKRIRPWWTLAVSSVFVLAGVLVYFNVLQVPFQLYFVIGLGTVALLTVLLFFILDRKYLFLQNEEENLSIKFYDDNPTEEELNIFLSHLKKAQRMRLQHKYLTFDENMSYEDYKKNIQWLWDNEFLSEEEAKQRLGMGDLSVN